MVSTVRFFSTRWRSKSVGTSKLKIISFGFILDRRFDKLHFLVVLICDMAPGGNYKASQPATVISQLTDKCQWWHVLVSI